MKQLKKLMLMAGVAAALSAGSLNVKAQGFDPEQMRQRMMERAREVLDVQKDDEWKIISERLEKVMTARRDVMAFGGGGMGFGGRGGRRNGGQGGDNANAGGGQGGQRRGGFFGEQPQEAKDLQAAVEAKAPADEMKAKLEKFRAAKKAKEDALTKAQASLKEVLSARQEAAAVVNGYLN